jgi:poly(A) polymerase
MSHMLETILVLAEQFRTAGHALYLVGGTVRDALQGREASPDVDMTTDATPDAIKRLSAATHPRAIVLVGERFGTVRLHYALEWDDGTGHEDTKIQEGHGDDAEVGPPPDLIIEITTYRAEQYNPDSRKPEVSFGISLEEDLLRRDFTINAMAQDPLAGVVIDPFGGQRDLAERVIRAVGDAPEQRFADDPLRMLRAVRFAAQLDFAIEPHTADAIMRQAGTLEKISKERIRDEFNKLLLSTRPVMGIRLAVDLDLMPYIIPEVMELRGVNQKLVGHSKDVYEHVLRVVQGSPPRLASRWAGLLHDIAKPRTRTFENGQVHFFAHEDVGAVMARDILKRLHFDRPFIDHVSLLVKLHAGPVARRHHELPRGKGLTRDRPGGGTRSADAADPRGRRPRADQSATGWQRPHGPLWSRSWSLAQAHQRTPAEPGH